MVERVVGEIVVGEEELGGVIEEVIDEGVLEEGRVEEVFDLTAFAKLRVLKVGFSLRKINLACCLDTLDLACTAKISASYLYS